MKNPGPSGAVERLFPFVLRSRNLLVGRESLWRSRRKLHFVLITTDLSEKSRAEILSDFAPYPIVQCYTAAELERFFGIRGAKVVGFQKSSLAQSLYAALKKDRINQPTPTPAPASQTAEGSPPAKDQTSPQQEQQSRRT
jgi:hypothetical protein